MKYSGAEITIKLLEIMGIEIISGIPGGSNLPIYDALYDSKIKHILVRHEQSAGFIAQGMARTTGNAAVCFATSGPGVVNLLTAIADAKLDSIPVVAITGQVAYSLIGTDAFQEVDAYGLTVPITKHNFLVRSIWELFEVIPEAFRIAESGRPGPVLVDIPKDIQTQVIEFDKWPDINIKNEMIKVDTLEIEHAAQMIKNSNKPMLYIGGGVTNSGSYDLIYELAKKNNIPVASTLMGLGSFPCDDELYLGMLGMHGARYTNYLLNDVDLLLAFGVRFDDRATGKVSKFCPNAKIIHVDIDESEINKIKQSDLSITGDLSCILKELNKYVSENPREEWISYLKMLKTSYPFVLPNKEDLLHPINVIKTVSSYLDSDTIITTDVGQHQMWVAQAYPFNKPRTLLTSGGLGTMGFGLPAAIGAALSNPDKKVVCFSGDGSILMNIQELATLADLKLNVTIILLNNGHLGLVRQQQEMFYNKHYIASEFIKNPDFAAISKGFGIKGYDLNGEEKPYEIIYKALSEKEPCFVNVPINYLEDVVPMVPPGAGNNEMIGGDFNE
ncbi:MAG: biosynthetic-type acetolactate synthase large subunit [Bacillota bacterium]|nr:biosynthetic-type acetolactate synthase large subunit [Bacillota bacterium]